VTPAHRNVTNPHLRLMASAHLKKSLAVRLRLDDVDYAAAILFESLRL
jgi:hypothetical protein